MLQIWYAYNWIETYISDRSQCVEISRLDNKNELTQYRSTLQTTKRGVPQGSVLGPLLFVLYVNDIPQVTSNQIIMYADDLSIIIADKSDPLTFQILVNKAVNDIQLW